MASSTRNRYVAAVLTVVSVVIIAFVGSLARETARTGLSRNAKTRNISSGQGVGQRRQPAPRSTKNKKDAPHYYNREVVERVLEKYATKAPGPPVFPLPPKEDAARIQQQVPDIDTSWVDRIGTPVVPDSALAPRPLSPPPSAPAPEGDLDWVDRIGHDVSPRTLGRMANQAYANRAATRDIEKSWFPSLKAGAIGGLTPFGTILLRMTGRGEEADQQHRVSTAYQQAAEQEAQRAWDAGEAWMPPGVKRVGRGTMFVLPSIIAAGIAGAVGLFLWRQSQPAKPDIRTMSQKERAAYVAQKMAERMGGEMPAEQKAQAPKADADAILDQIDDVLLNEQYMATPRKQEDLRLEELPPKERIERVVGWIRADPQLDADLLQRWLDEMQERAMNMEAPTDEYLAKRLLRRLGATQGISFDEDE